jgi:hypothetical protein
MDIHKGGFYPYDFTSMIVIGTTDNKTILTSGSLVNGHIYSILSTPIGGTPSFAGATNIDAGTQFVATGTNATWGTDITGELVDVTDGKPTEIAFYQKASLVFIWHYIYNEDDFCTSYVVTDSNGNLIK